MSTTSRKRKVLTLEQRFAVLKEAEKGKSCHAIAQEVRLARHKSSQL